MHLGELLTENAGPDNNGRRLCNARICTALTEKLCRISFTLSVGLYANCCNL